MLRWSLTIVAAAGALVLGAVIEQCSNPPERVESGSALTFNEDETAQLLPGTWLREYQEDGVQVRRLLTLEPRGAFHEVARVTGRDGKVTQFVHEGTWLFDGTNLKRRYSSMNGEPPSRLRVPFATFAIVFQTRNEFTGVDHIHHVEIHYERVEDGTEL